MPDNPKDGQIYIDDDGTVWQFNNGNWRGGIEAVEIWGEGRGGSGGGMIGNSGNIYFQEMMNRHNEMLAYMDACSNARWEAMQAQLRLEEALRRAEVAKDYRDMTAARQKAQALKQGIQENARNGAKVFTALNIGLTTAGVYGGVKESQILRNGKWKGLNGKWYDLSWGGNGQTGSRASVVGTGNKYKTLGRFAFYGSAAISTYNASEAYLTGDYDKIGKAGLDVGFGALATYGGMPGLVVGTGYFILDLGGTFDRPDVTSPYDSPFRSVQDNTYNYIQFQLLK